MKAFRVNRLFNPKSNRCFDVALDHGLFNQQGFLLGIESMPTVIRDMVKAKPDAIQLTVGQAHHLQSIPGKQKPSLVLRADVANVYGIKLPKICFSRTMDECILQAVRLDAVCVCVNLFQIPGRPEIHQQCVENILRLKPQADYFAMPMMVEPLVFQPNKTAGGYMVDGDVVKIMHLVRQAVELGADVIKADPSKDTLLFHKVVEIAGGVPVLVRGGGRVGDREILRRTNALLTQGVRGIVYGRNIIQHPNPIGITNALMAIIHKQCTVEQALALVSRP